MPEEHDCNVMGDDLEFACREYIVATNHFIEVLRRYEEIPPRIAAETMALADAINEEWGA